MPPGRGFSLPAFRLAQAGGHLAAPLCHPYPKPMVSIATWNINSVRLRIDQVVRLLEQERPDVLCLQEIKCREEQFPHAPFEALGYTHRVVEGTRQWDAPSDHVPLITEFDL